MAEPRELNQEDNSDLCNPRYSLEAKLGEGTFAKVYLCQDLHFVTGERLVAIKKLNDFSSAICELTALEAFRDDPPHPSIVNVYEYYTKGRGYYKNLFLVQEYMSGGDLYDYLHRGNLEYLPLAKVQLWFGQLVSALEYLHQEKSIVHRDIKLENLLLSHSGLRLKLCDFGMACLDKGQLVEDSPGSPAYIAPEVTRWPRKPFLLKPVDMWAMGVVLYAMLFSCYPFWEEEQVKLYRKVRTEEPQWLTDIESIDSTSERHQALLLCQGLLEKQVNQRLSIKSVASHPFFQERLDIILDDEKERLDHEDEEIILNHDSFQSSSIDSI
jgi:serine/threonine protein kinase